MPTIAIVAPSAYAPVPEKVLRAVDRLQRRGWQVKLVADPASRDLRFSDSDQNRLNQLYQAAEDPEVDLVLAMRGGYGVSRLLDQIDFNRLADSGKLFGGFSDFTAIHMGLLAKTGTVSFAAPMSYDDFGADDEHVFSFDQFQACFTRPDYSVEVQIENNPDVSARGQFWGGNLAMLCHLVGTPFMPQIDGGILFVEDVNENPYRVERMLLQMYFSGILKRQKALVLGHFTHYKPSEYDNGYDFDSMLSYIRDKIQVPVLLGLPFGHCANKVTLPIGAKCQLNSTKTGFHLSFSDYPHFQPF